MCSAWYSSLNSRFNSRMNSTLQILDKICIRFCLSLNNRAHIGLNELEKINWIPINDRFEQFISSMTFKNLSNLSPLYINDAFKPAGQSTAAGRTSLHKLSQAMWKANQIKSIKSQANQKPTKNVFYMWHLVSGINCQT